MGYVEAAVALFQSTDPLNLGSPWQSWAASVKPFYTKHTVVIAFIAALYLPVVYALRDIVECYLPGGFKQQRAAKKKHDEAEAHLADAKAAAKSGGGEADLKALAVAEYLERRASAELAQANSDFKRQANFDKTWLKLPLILWNLALMLFSMWGAYHLVPHMYTRLSLKEGFGHAIGQIDTVICDSSCYNNPVAMVMLYFNLSKMPEFVDTLFLRLRKRPVILLHWYHHIMTMLYCWYANQEGVEFNCSGMFFATMNLCVHSVMYLYYALAAAGFAKIMAKYNLNVVLTTGQIVQMVGGVLILYKSVNCQQFDQRGFVIGTVMYTSYLLLFCKLFIDKYHNKFRGLCPCTSRHAKIKAQ